MSAHCIDGRSLAQHIQTEVKTAIVARTREGQRPPGLAVILVGEDPASHIYVRNKRQACQAVGIHSHAFYYLPSVETKTLLHKIQALNEDSHIDGILVQLPLPAHIEQERILESISPYKDVDGFHPYNLGKLAQRQPFLRPCTPYGVISLLNHLKLPLKGQNACVVGASSIVGRPMALELLNQDMTVTVCHRFTQNLPKHLLEADLVVVAIGKPAFIQGDWIKPQAVVVDIGINRTEAGKIVGDVDFNAAQKRASWITPVPGGVGPMTVASLLQNTLLAASRPL